jgi:hypothetical protein
VGAGGAAAEAVQVLDQDDGELPAVGGGEHLVETGSADHRSAAAGGVEVGSRLDPAVLLGVGLAQGELILDGLEGLMFGRVAGVLCIKRARRREVVHEEASCTLEPTSRAPATVWRATPKPFSSVSSA